MEPPRPGQNGGGSAVSPPAPGASVAPKEREQVTAPPPVTSPTSHHTIPQSTPHHHHHHHHHTHAAPANPSDRQGLPPAALPQSANYTPSQPQPRIDRSRLYGPGGERRGLEPRALEAYPHSPPRARARTPPMAAKPSVSPQPAAGSVRPDIPIFGAMRSLPSPFDNPRDGPSGQAQIAHHRTGSSSSARAAYPTQQLSSAPPPAARREFSPPHQSHPYNPAPETRRDVPRSPVSRPPSHAPSAPPNPPASGSNQPRHSGGAYPYSYSATYHPPARQAAGNSTAALPTPLARSANPFGLNTGGSSSSPYSRRDQDRERERDAQAQDRARTERDLRQREDRQREDAKRAQGDAFLADVRRRDREDEERRKTAAAGKSSRPGYPQEPGSMISQVAPTREPRPYNYKAEPLPNNPPPATNGQQSTAQRERDYYNGRDRERERDPRENRSRMDLAVEEQNKRSATAQVSAVARKRKKEDSGGGVPSKILRQPATAVAAPRRDWRDLTEVGTSDTPTEDKAVKRWREEGDTALVYSYDYNGRTVGDLGLDSDWVGARVDVRIGAGYLGRAWKLPTEDGWAEADTLSHGEALGLKAGGIVEHDLGSDVRLGHLWGTSVYTDDSSIGCILIHAGHLRWTKDEDLDPDRRERLVEEDGLLVSFRILPPMTLYVGNTHNGIRSQKWGNGHDGYSVSVEEVKRIPNYHQSTLRESGRKRLKTRVRDFIVQRKAAEVERGLDGQKEALAFSSISYEAASQAMFKYRPDALADWTAKGDPRNVWVSDLELECGKETYMLSAEAYPTDDGPRYHVVLNQTDSSDEGFHFSLPPNRYTWTDDGLVVQIDDKQGEFYLVDGYRWLPRQTKVRTQEDGEEMDV